MWDKLSMPERAEVMKLAVQNGIYDLDTIIGGYNEYAKGGKIHIKPENRGKLTALKQRTGKTEAELYNDGNPAHKKMVVFARNSRKWKHGDGGNLFAPGGEIEDYVSARNYYKHIPTRSHTGWSDEIYDIAEQCHQKLYRYCKDTKIIPDSVSYNDYLQGKAFK
jgi:hypothetical protein